MERLHLGHALRVAVSRAWRSAVGLARTCCVIDARPYKPEAYYMRGPGPAWREKQAREHAQSL
jgi:hypothetical protein